MTETDDAPDIDDPDEFADRARNRVVSFLANDLDDIDDEAERFTAEFDHLNAYAEDIALAIDAGLPEHRKSRYAGAVEKHSGDTKTSIIDEIDEKLADIKRERIADHESGITDTDAFVELATMSSETAAKNTRRVRELGAEAFIETDDEHFATPRVEGGEVNKTTLYRYDETTGAYEPTGDARVHELLAELLDVMHTSDIKEVVNRLKRRSFVDRDAFDAGNDHRDLINLADCVLDISDPADPERVEHSPEFLFRTSIPRHFDEGGECPAIDAFMQEVCPDDVARKTLYEWIGFCLQPGYQLHRFLLLTGSGGNGKGVFFRLLRTFLGGDNAGSVTWNALTSGEGGFQAQALEGKKVNIDSDIPSRGLGGDEVDMLKRLTGGDTVQVDVKYQSPFDLDNTAKLAFGANEPPRFYGATGAIARRLLPIEFPFNFVNDPADDDPAQKQRRSESDLETELFTDDELDGLLRKALAGLARVEANDQFSIEARGTRGERFAEYMAEADSIVGFASDCLTNEEGRAIPNEVVHAAYVRWCQANDRSAADKRTLFKKLRSETGVDIHKKRTRADIGENQTAWYSDRLWVTDDALPYLTRGAREDIETLVRHRYGSAADYVADYLLRSTAPDDSGDSGDDDSRPSQLDLMRALTEAVSDADSDGVARIEVIADLDKRGFDAERVRGAIDKWLSDGTLISADGGDGEYILPGQ